MIHNLVNRIYGCTQSYVQNFGYVYRDKDLQAWIIIHLKFTCHVFGYRFQQFEEPQIRSVSGLSLFQSVDDCFTIMPIDHKIRLPDPERDHVIFRLHQLKKSRMPDLGISRTCWSIKFFFLQYNSRTDFRFFRIITTLGMK